MRTTRKGGGATNSSHPTHNTGARARRRSMQCSFSQKLRETESCEGTAATRQGYFEMQGRGSSMPAAEGGSSEGDIRNGSSNRGGVSSHKVEQQQQTYGAAYSTNTNSCCDNNGKDTNIATATNRALAVGAEATATNRAATEGSRSNSNE